MMDYNNAFQLLGLNANKFRRHSGKLIRGGAFVNMRDEWGNEDAARRQALWEALMVCLKYIRNTLLIYIFLFGFFFFFYFFFFIIYKILNCADGVLHPSKV
jgi:hypothetical protein